MYAHTYVKRAICLALTAFLLAGGALAEVAPANPNTPVRTTGQPAQTATPAPDATATPAPTTITVPVPDESEYVYNYVDEPVQMLDEDMRAQLDAEILDLLDTEGFETIQPIHGTRNILLAGLDARPGETASRSDTMMLLSVNGDAGTIKLISFLRDTYVAIPGHGNNRLNVPWVYGGAQLLLDTLEENFGVKIDEYAAVDITLLIDLVDAVGGLTLTVENDSQLRAINGVIDAYNYQFDEPLNDGLLTQTGEQHMNGKQVQAYARFRKVDSDFQRTERQREVIVKLFEQIQTMSALQLTLIASNHVDRLATNMTLTDIVSLIPAMFLLADAEVEELRIPADGAYEAKTVSGMSVILPNLAENRRLLEEFLSK